MSILDVAYDALFNKGRKTQEKVQNVYNKVADTYNKVVNSPEVQFLSEPVIAQKIQQRNADNQLWRAYENFINRYKDYQNDKNNYYTLLQAEDAANNYNRTLSQLWGTTEWWPTWIGGGWINVGDLNAYKQYWEPHNYSAVERGFGWNKWKAIYEWEKFVPQDIYKTDKIRTASKLIREMDTITKLIPMLEQLQIASMNEYNVAINSGQSDKAKKAMSNYENFARKTNSIKNTLRDKKTEYDNLVYSY